MLDASFALKVFAALFAIMNPLANMPVFLSLTDGSTAAKQRKIAVTTMIAVTFGCLVSTFAGNAILGMFGVTIDDFRLAGGLMVLLIALSMLHGSASPQHQPGAAEMSAEQQSVAIYPLTIPLLVGPGTIATLTVFGATAMSEGKILSLVIGLVAFLAVLGVALLAAPAVGRHLPPRVPAIAKRLMGMILAAIAVSMMVASVQSLFGTTASGMAK